MSWPGALICMTPFQLHWIWELSFSAGVLPINTVGAPGVHCGMLITGTQGCGALLAAATCGLVVEIQFPKGMILTMGLLSNTVAAGFISINTFLSGDTASVDGLVPKVQVKLAPAHTHIPIGDPFLIINY